MSRNYTYDTAYENSPAQIKNREARNRARAHEEKKVGASAIKGKDIDHKKSLKGGGSKTADSNLRVRTIHSNRGDKSF